MSFLIEFFQTQDPSPNIFNYLSKTIKQALRNPKFCQLNYFQQQQTIYFSLGGSPQTLYIPSVWKFKVKERLLRIEIGFIEPGKQMPMRIACERLKIECCSIMRAINVQLYPQYRFFLNPGSGLLLLNVQVTMQELEDIVKLKGGMSRLIQNTFMVLRNYFDEVSCFAYDINKNIQYGNKLVQNSALQAIASANKFRFLLQSGIKQRKRVQYIIKMKQANQKFQAQQNVKSMRIYLNIVESLRLLNFGIEQLFQHSTSQMLFQKQKHQLLKNTIGIATNTEDKKIVYGITKMNQRGPKQLISKSGAHSQVYMQFYYYSTVQTVHYSVNQQWRQKLNYKQQKCRGYLAIKKCKNTSETSINSFLNELKVLEFLKEKKNPFVARYFLLLKSYGIRDQKDFIYITAYKENLYQLIRNHTSMTIIQKLKISYRISKALCFFSINLMIHRDLKPQNIMIDKNYNPKVIDFGSCVPVHNSDCFRVHDYRRKMMYYTVLTTPKFSMHYEKLPENLKKRYRQQQYQEHKLFDIFSFGKILCYLFFNSLSVPTYEQAINYGQALLMEHLLWIIELCLSEDPDNRPGYGQLASFLGCLNKIMEL